MNQKGRTPGLILTMVVITGALVMLYKLVTTKQETMEGKLMATACEDIKTHETVRAESDLDKIAETISTHVHSYRDQSDTVIAQAVMDLRALREEVVFRNTDTEMYFAHFTRILNQLSYLEMEDAMDYLEKGERKEATKAVNRAKHYLHDALTFSKASSLDKQMEALHRINGFDPDRLNSEEIEGSMKMVKKLI